MVDWQAILSKHRAGMWRAVYRILRNYDDALECCQDALLDAHQFTLKSTVVDWGPFLIALGTRRAIDRLRKQLSYRNLELSLEVVLYELSGDAAGKRFASMKWIYTDFDWDPNVENIDTLFSTEPPNGYEFEDHTKKF